ncbi:hypothetical protein [Amycolatopsis australiensis]|uniref:Uncharacterized protein n=1 Tax=Amycolatopsis australiensis TaxID=546364 RepID=A0A1K1SVI2_9PSEU|nr:hypothetical protein [Amycolatopsis australiensis]SFW88330.1 hypothetical protein SAMN04489730_6926 [Amycolatopsis australiensis]
MTVPDQRRIEQYHREGFLLVPEALAVRDVRRLQDRTELVTGLLRRGVIDGDFTGERDEIMWCRRLSATWLLHRAEYATTVYEDRYPDALAQLGIPLEAGTHTAAWRRGLTEA